MMLRKTLFIFTIAILLIFLGLVFYFVFFRSGINGGLEQVTSNVVAFYQQEQASGADFPVRLKIPKINIDTAIEYVDISPNGVVGVPNGPINVGWFKEGPRPGDLGSAVIDGHSGWKNGISAVFDNLYKLQKGDKIYVEDKKGIILTFIVQKIVKYKPNADASDLFNSNDGKSHLNLVTCAGVWDVKAKSHSERLVVFADRANPASPLIGNRK